MNAYTIDVLIYQRTVMQRKLDSAEYADERLFYSQCLAEIDKDIDNISKNATISSKNSDNSCISE